MANYADSNLLNAQAKLLGLFQQGALKYRYPSTFLAVKASAPNFYANYEALRTREDRVLTALYRKRTSRSLSSARSHEHQGVKGDTGVLTPTWATYSDKFAMHLKQANKNNYSLDEMLANEVENVVYNFAEGLETAATAFVFNNRSGVNVAQEEGTFDAATDTFEIVSTKEKRTGQIIASVMAINKYSTGGLMVFCDTTLYNKVLFYGAQGVSNNENLSFMFMGITWVLSIELHASAAALGYSNGYGVAFVNGMIGCLDHIPTENKNGVITTVSKYGVILNPVDSLNYAIHEYEARANGTSTGGYTQDVLTEREVSVDLTFDVAPLMAASETPLLAFGITEAAV